MNVLGIDSLRATMSKLRIVPNEQPQPEKCTHCNGLTMVKANGQPRPCACYLDEYNRTGRADRLERAGLDGLDALRFERLTDNKITESRAFAIAKLYVTNGSGLLLFRGDTGTYKTYLAGSIANARFDVGQSVLFATVPDLLTDLKATYTDGSHESESDIIHRCQAVGLLVLDDYGTHKTQRGMEQTWADRVLFQIIGTRINRRRDTVTTTNLPLRDIDMRLRSRLTDSQLATVVETRS